MVEAVGPSLASTAPDTSTASLSCDHSQPRLDWFPPLPWQQMVAPPLSRRGLSRAPVAPSACRYRHSEPVSTCSLLPCPAYLSRDSGSVPVVSHVAARRAVSSQPKSTHSASAHG